MKMKKVLNSVSVASIGLMTFVSPAFALTSTPDDSYSETLDSVISLFVNWAAILAGLIALAFLIIAGIKYVTSSGDPGKTEEAQKQIVSAIIGLAIVVLSYTILRVVLYLFNVEFGVDALENISSELMPT